MSAIVSCTYTTVGCTSHLVLKHFGASKVMLLMNFPAIMQQVLLVNFQVGDGDPFAQLLQKLWTRQSLIFLAVVSSTWFCCSQLVKDVIESIWAAGAACSLSSWCYPKCHSRRLLELVILFIFILVEHGKSCAFHACFLNFVFIWQGYLWCVVEN
jgi:hypothetical protein